MTHSKIKFLITEEREGESNGLNSLSPSVVFFPEGLKQSLYNTHSIRANGRVKRFLSHIINKKPLFSKENKGEEQGTPLNPSPIYNPILIYKYINIFLYSNPTQSKREKETLSIIKRLLFLSMVNSVNFGNVNPTGFKK